MVQVPYYIAVRPDDITNSFRMRLVGQPSRGHGDETFCLELVGIEQIAHEGLRVVGLVEDIGEDEEAGFGVACACSIV